MLLLWLALASPACTPDSVAPNLFVRTDAAPEASAGLPDPSLPPAVGDAAPIPAPDLAPLAGAGKAQDAACDLNGRWLVAQRILATAVGQSQASHNWFLYEIRHDGATVTVSKGLHCGFEVIKKTALAATVDSSGAWPALLERNSSTGRAGTFVADTAGGGCRLTLDQEYVVRGATLPHYLDARNKLPERNQAAAGGSPGWEDWDADGNPGISFKVSSALASGTLYTCQREWTRYDGVTPAGAVKLKVAIKYGIEQIALGRSAGAPQALETTSAPASDPAQHYAWFHRLAAGQAVGTDAEICAAIRTLRTTLVPEANQ